MEEKKYREGMEKRKGDRKWSTADFQNDLALHAPDSVLKTYYPNHTREDILKVMKTEEKIREKIRETKSKK